MKIVSFDLIYDGERWIAKNDDIVASGETFDELDEDIKTKLEKRSDFTGKVKVTMEFDYRTIPAWIRQYHPYYLHRVILFEF